MCPCPGSTTTEPCGSWKVPGQAHAGELPACLRWKEISIRRAGMAARRHARSATQDELIAHELAVVFAQGPGQWCIARIGDVGAGCPLPDIAEHLVERPGLATRAGGGRMIAT